MISSDSLHLTTITTPTASSHHVSGLLEEALGVLENKNPSLLIMGPYNTSCFILTTSLFCSPQNTQFLKCPYTHTPEWATAKSNTDFVCINGHYKISFLDITNSFQPSI